MEVVKLRAHHIIKMTRLINREHDLLDDINRFRKAGYEEDVVNKVIYLYMNVFGNPKQQIEILPEQDYDHDPICQCCIRNKAENKCELPLPPNEIGRDQLRANQYGLEFGATISVGELWGIQPIPVFTKE